MHHFYWQPGSVVAKDVCLCVCVSVCCGVSKGLDSLLALRAVCMNFSAFQRHEVRKAPAEYL